MLGEQERDNIVKSLIPFRRYLKTNDVNLFNISTLYVEMNAIKRDLIRLEGNQKPVRETTIEECQTEWNKEMEKYKILAKIIEEKTGKTITELTEEDLKNIGAEKVQEIENEYFKQGDEWVKAYNNTFNQQTEAKKEGLSKIKKSKYMKLKLMPTILDSAQSSRKNSATLQTTSQQLYDTYVKEFIAQHGNEFDGKPLTIEEWQKQYETPAKTDNYEDDFEQEEPKKPSELEKLLAEPDEELVKKELTPHQIEMQKIKDDFAKIKTNTAQARPKTGVKKVYYNVFQEQEILPDLPKTSKLDQRMQKVSESQPNLAVLGQKIPQRPKTTKTVLITQQNNNLLCSKRDLENQRQQALKRLAADLKSNEANKMPNSSDGNVAKNRLMKNGLPSGAGRPSSGR